MSKNTLSDIQINPSMKERHLGSCSVRTNMWPGRLRSLTLQGEAGRYLVSLCTRDLGALGIDIGIGTSN